MRWAALLVGLLLAMPAQADMYQNGSNAKKPEVYAGLGVAPSVATNAALAAVTNTSHPNGVWRLSVVAEGDAPPLYFAVDVAACTNADGYVELTLSDGGCAKAVFEEGLDIRQEGASATASDNAAAINRAIAYAQTTKFLGQAGYWLPVIIPAGLYRVATPINMTCINNLFAGDGGCPATADGRTFRLINRGMIGCATSGLPCIDALASWSLDFDHLRLEGYCGPTQPSVGIQTGRVVDHHSVNNQHFNRPYFTGCYSKAAYYNLGTENVYINTPYFRNQDTTHAPDAYAAIFDSGNHWNTTSTFVTQTIPVDTPNGTCCNTVSGGLMAHGVGTARPLWIYGTQGLRLINNLYLNTSGSDQSVPCITIYNDGTAGTNTFGFSFARPTGLIAHTHCEGPGGGYNNYFLISSKTAVSDFIINHLDLDDYTHAVNTAVFGRDANTNRVTITDPVINTPAVVVANKPLFDDRTKWLVNNAQNINASALGSGYRATFASTNFGTGAALAIGATDLGDPRGFSLTITTGTGTGTSGTLTVTPPYTRAGALVCRIDAVNIGAATWPADMVFNVAFGTGQDHCLWTWSTAIGLVDSTAYAVQVSIR